jgi:hypothetical protein
MWGSSLSLTGTAQSGYVEEEKAIAHVHLALFLEIAARMGVE